MASLPQTPLIEVKLPKSGIVCQIGMNYGDKIAIRNALLGDGEIELSQKVEIPVEGKTPGVKPADSDKPETVNTTRKFSVAMMQKLDETYFTRCLKSWDCEDQPSVENIYKLEKEDGEFLLACIKDLDAEDISKEDKKK